MMTRKAWVPALALALLAGRSVLAGGSDATNQVPSAAVAVPATDPSRRSINVTTHARIGRQFPVPMRAILAECSAPPVNLVRKLSDNINELLPAAKPAV